jgi:uncharacterized membrane protein YbhN (UPF0104 family)
VKFHFPSIRKLSPIFTIIVFGFAIWVIVFELRHHSPSQILTKIREIEPSKVAMALCLVVPGLTALACYDLVAARYLRLGIGWWRPLCTGYLGYSITNTTGHAVIVGGLLRLRIYPRWNITGKQVGEIVGFGVLTYYLGLSVTAAAAFIFEGGDLASVLGQAPVIGPVIGHAWFRIAVPTVLLIGIVGWFLLLCLRRRPIKFRQHEFKLPHPFIGILQLFVSVGDLAIAASVLYVLLPNHHGLEWLSFVGIFSVVQFAALMSAVPGGVGVFSGIMLVILRPIDPSGAAVFASLLAFRVLYYFVPFGIGGLSFLAIIVTQHAHRNHGHEGLKDATDPDSAQS